MAKEERSEDLNPTNKELDEKIRQLMDPSIPDSPDQKDKKAKSDKPKIENVSAPKPISDEPEQPETDDDKEPVIEPSKKSRKVIVPVQQDEKSTEESEVTKEESPPEVTEDAEQDIAETPKEKPVVKIDVDHQESDPQEEKTEKLDPAINELVEPKKKKVDDETDEPEKPDDEETEPTAPLLEGQEEPFDEPEEKPSKKSPAKAKQASPSKPDETDEPLPKPKVVEDPDTDKAVKDIVAAESDTLLQVEDAIREAEDDVKPARKKISLSAIFLNKKALKAYLVLLIVGLVAAAAYPVSRYRILNAAGVRSSSVITVMDSSSQQPLKNVTVSIGGISGKTDINGAVKLDKLRLGPSTLKIERLAFATIEKPVVIGWGSNPLGSFGLVPTGEQYKIEISDFLSGKPIANVEAESDHADAKSDENGLIILTVPETDSAEINVRIKVGGYREETIVLQLAAKDTVKVKLAPSRKHVFVSKRSGKYDIYSIYVDGKHEQLLLSGSGHEKEDLALLPHQTQNLVAYVSTRAGKSNSDGYLLNDLILLDSESGKTTPIIASERVQIVGWVGDRLVFVAITSGPSAVTAQRNKLLSYSLDDGKTTELATSNYFNDISLAQGKIYFAPSSAVSGGTPAELFVVNADGSNKKSIFKQEVWKMLRTSYDHFALTVGAQWYEHKLGEGDAKKLDNAPASKTGRVYLDSPDKTKSAWIDQRDGKGTLLIHEVADGKETTLASRTGLSLPVVWLNGQTLIFRVENKDETADYVVSLNGGEAVKVRDVTKTSGIDNWYYY